MDTKQGVNHSSGTQVLPGRQFPPHIVYPLDRLTLSLDDHILRGAGIPSYAEGVFARDEIITSELLEDSKGLREILRFAARMQGKKKDPATGEQWGAIFHEYNLKHGGGVELVGRPGLNTLYNASDTNAHFLRGHLQYIEMTGDSSLFDEQRSNVVYATEYILRHLDANHLFVVDPKHSDAQRYALRVTYWKDSVLKDREGGEPVYPVVYPLSHIQNMAGVRAAAELLGSEELRQTAQDMRQAIVHLFDNNIEGLSIAIDQRGRISGINSDVLHALHYLEPDDIDPSTLERFLANTTSLETPFGFRTLSADNANEVEDAYHAKTVWTHEQAIIHKGARRHREWAQSHGEEGLARALARVERVSSQVYTNYLKANLESNPELFLILQDGEIVPGGNDPQAWAVGARYYFERALSEERIAAFT